MSVKIIFEDIRVWFDHTLEVMGWTVHDFAVNADTSPINLVRFIVSCGPGRNAYQMSWTTVGKLASVSPVPLAWDIAAVLKVAEGLAEIDRERALTPERVSALLNSLKAGPPSCETLRKIAEVTPEEHRAEASRAVEARARYMAQIPRPLPPELTRIAGLRPRPD